MRKTLSNEDDPILREKEQAALRAIIDAAFTPEEKQVFQSQDKQVVELFMPMYTVLRDSVRRYIREGEDPSRLVDQIRDCRQANAADASVGAHMEPTPLSRLLSEKQEDTIQDEAGHMLTHLQSVIVDRHVIPNNKLTNHIAGHVDDVGMFKLPVSAATKRAMPMKVICSLAYEDENLKISGRRPFTEYDRNVYNALVSLYVYGDQSHIVTPQTVYRAMVGMAATENPGKQQIEAVTESLDKMRFTRTVINCTDEIKRRKSIPGRKYAGMGMIDTYLLDATVVHVEAGGKTVRAYRINSAPVLYGYSRLLNEVLTVPSSLLDIRATSEDGEITGERVNNTESRIQIKGYLLRRIEGMKGSNSLKSRTIALDGYDKDDIHHKGLYEIAGLTAGASRKAQKTVRDYAEQVLGYWKANGYISGHSFLTARRTITGIQIDV